MTADIKKVAVIGAGVMGASIAAHVANAGVPVLLLDIVPHDAASRNRARYRRTSITGWSSANANISSVSTRRWTS
jgi:3-hydroxyacyl-CoA dehydrogenase